MSIFVIAGILLGSLLFTPVIIDTTTSALKLPKKTDFRGDPINPVVKRSSKNSTSQTQTPKRP
ncbi:hypothetical protein [Bartonella sp. F02]|uniref:hypothetical protein n=1 Tax=Bartonella sp. F02 TaxID=2967262 RepID=UPI0022A9E0A9|nr:hypothetical protein [Bartonella sp. F02]MCZ2328682.1 hypothetical protein [Bartonella sp. F02]